MTTGITLLEGAGENEDGRSYESGRMVEAVVEPKPWPSGFLRDSRKPSLFTPITVMGHLEEMVRKTFV